MHLLLKLISSPWFWIDVFFGTVGALIVVRGLTLESRAEKFMPPEEFKLDVFQDIIESQKKLLRRGERLVLIGCLIEAIASFVLSIISGLEIAETNERAEQANERAALIESNDLVMGTNLANLNEKTLALAHQYDLSTNALADANARLASIRPLKERLVEWFNRCDPSILQKLKLGQFSFKLTVTPPAYSQMYSMLTEPDSGTFCESFGDFKHNIVSGGPETVEATIVLRPALAK